MSFKIYFSFLVRQIGQKDLKVLANKIGPVTDPIEEPCLARVDDNQELDKYNIKSAYDGNPEDKMFDVPCNLKLNYICAVAIPGALQKVDEMTGTKEAEWPSCVMPNKILKTHQVSVIIEVDFFHSIISDKNNFGKILRSTENSS